MYFTAVYQYRVYADLGISGDRRGETGFRAVLFPERDLRPAADDACKYVVAHVRIDAGRAGHGIFGRLPCRIPVPPAEPCGPKGSVTELLVKMAGNVIFNEKI